MIREIEPAQLRTPLNQKHWLAASILLAGCAPLVAHAQSAIRINELQLVSGESPQGEPIFASVELYNTGATAESVNGYTLINSSGVTIATLPALNVPSNGFLTVRFGTGIDDTDFSDGEGTYFTQGPATGIFAFEEEECGLYPGDPGSVTVTDYVGWSFSAEFAGGTANAAAIAAGIWSADAFVDLSGYGQLSVIGRTPDGFDNNDPTDWRNYDWGIYQATGSVIGAENPIQITPSVGGLLEETTPDLSWASLTNVTGYELEVDDNADFSSPEISISTTGTTHTVTAALPDGQYFWRVRVRDGVGALVQEHAVWSFVKLWAVTIPDDDGPATLLRGTTVEARFVTGFTREIQHKDTNLLCVWNQCPNRGDTDTRPGCSETASANGPWDAAHPATTGHVPNCEHCSWYCSRASIQMVNNRYGGTLSQDRISYRMFNTANPQPEGDLGHNCGTTLNQRHEAYAWSLNLLQNQVFRATGKPTWFTIMTEVDNGRPIYIDGANHATVLRGYVEVTPQGGQVSRFVIIANPWPGTPAKINYDTWQPDGTGWGRGAYFRIPAGTITGRMQEALVTADLDGDLVRDFDEISRFQSSDFSSDSDDDQINDKNEIRNYTFHDTYHVTHNNDALTFADSDNDGLRAEADCDSDTSTMGPNDGEFDGGEDIDGDGHCPEAGETCLFDNTSSQQSISVSKDIYFIGEAVNIVDLHGTRESHTFHANSTYAFELEGECPDKENNSFLSMSGMFDTDSNGHAIETLASFCLQPGVFHLTVDILNDDVYREPECNDPQTCWECHKLLWDGVFAEQIGATFSESSWKFESGIVATTFAGGVASAGSAFAYDQVGSLACPDCWNWYADYVFSGTPTRTNVEVANMVGDPQVQVEIVASPQFVSGETTLAVNVSADTYEIRDQSGTPVWTGIWSQYPGDINPILGFQTTGILRRNFRGCGTCAGDLDGSGTVDAADAALMANAIVERATNPCTDVNLDGQGNGLDVQGFYDQSSANGGSGSLCGLDPVGACCSPTLGCQEGFTRDGCIAAGWAYQGDNTVCDGVTCPEPTGACCIDNASNCIDTSFTECISLDGAYKGDNTLCSVVGCDDVSGACCINEINCIDTVAGVCSNGVFHAQRDCASITCLGDAFWINSNSGNWNDGTNWSTGAPPVFGQNAIIDVPNDITVTYDSGTSMPFTVFSEETISITGGTLNPIANGSDIQTLIINNGTFEADGNTIIDTFTLAAGTMTGTAGVTIVNQMDWTGGLQTGGGTTDISTNGSLFLYDSVGSVTKMIRTRTMNNGGSATMTDTGPLLIDSGAVFNNLAGATFDVQSDADFDYFSGAPGSFNNDGTFSKTGGAGESQFEFFLAFNNNGTVNVQTGTLRLRGGGQSGGIWNSSTGTQINIDGGTYDANEGTSFIGDGVTQVTSGTFNANGTPVTIDNFDQVAGTVGGAGELLVQTNMNWTGGTQTDAGITTISSNGTLALSGVAAKALRVRTFNNAGMATLSDTGSLLVDSGAVFNNLAGATFDVQSDADLEFFSGNFTAFNNDGAFTKTGGTGLTDVDFGLAFNNDGTVTVQTGTLRFTGGGTNSGLIDTDTNATTEFASSNPIFVLDSGTSLDGDGQYRALGGTLDINNGVDVTIQNLEISGGKVNNNGKINSFVLGLNICDLLGTGDVDVLDQMTWTGGRQTGSGTTNITSNATLLLSGTSNKRLEANRTLNNAGSTAMTDTGSLFITSGAVFNNLAGATFDVQSDADFEYFSGALGTFNNDGAFTKSSGVDETRFEPNLTFNNDGTVSVQSGTLRLRGGGDSTGQWSVPFVSTEVHFDGATYDLNQGTTITGDGVATLTSNTLNINGAPVAIDNFDQISGTVGGLGNLLITTNMNWDGGTQTNAGTTMIPSNGTLDLNGPFTKSLRGGRTFNNTGTATMSGTGSFLIDSGAVFNNLAGATFDVQDDANLDFFGGTFSSFNNDGTFTKTGGAGMSDVDFGLAFNNDGTVSVQTGTLRLRGGGSNTGVLSIDSNAIVEFNADTFALMPGTANSGGGIWRTSGGTLDIESGVNLTPTDFEITAGVVDADGNVTAETLTIGGGSIQGTGNVSGNGNVNWNGGSMQEGGTTTVPPTGFFNIGGNFNKTLNGRTVNNQGTTTLSGTGDLFLNNGAVFNNLAGATFDVQDDADFAFSSGIASAFNNSGIFTKSGGTGDTVFPFNVQFTNDNSVEVQTGNLIFSGGFIQTGGNTTLNGGNIDVGSFIFDMNGGLLNGDGTIFGDGSTGGATFPGFSPGAIEFTGDFDQTTNGVLNIEIGGITQATEYDLIIVGGEASLGGTLSVSLINGFTPLVGDSFEIMTYSSQVGDFATYSGLDLGGGLQLQPSFGPSSLTLTVVQP